MPIVLEMLTEALEAVRRLRGRVDRLPEALSQGLELRLLQGQVEVAEPDLLAALGIEDAGDRGQLMQRISCEFCFQIIREAPDGEFFMWLTTCHVAERRSRTWLANSASSTCSMRRSRASGTNDLAAPAPSVRTSCQPLTQDGGSRCRLKDVGDEGRLPKSGHHGLSGTGGDGFDSSQGDGAAAVVCPALLFAACGGESADYTYEPPYRAPRAVLAIGLVHLGEYCEVAALPELGPGPSARETAHSMVRMAEVRRTTSLYIPKKYLDDRLAQCEEEDLDELEEEFEMLDAGPFVDPRDLRKTRRE